MATLHVRNIPDDLYAQLNRLASSESQSLSAEVVRLLSQAVEERDRRSSQKRILSSLRRRRFVPRAGAPESLELLREDRGR